MVCLLSLSAKMNDRFAMKVSGGGGKLHIINDIPMGRNYKTITEAFDFYRSFASKLFNT